MHRRPSRIDGIRRWWCEESLASEGDILESSVDHAFVEGFEPLAGVIAAHIPGCAPSRDLHGLGEGQSRSGRPLDPSPAFVGALDQASAPFQHTRIANHDPRLRAIMGGVGVGGIAGAIPRAQAEGIAHRNSWGVWGVLYGAVLGAYWG